MALSNLYLDLYIESENDSIINNPNEEIIRILKNAIKIIENELIDETTDFCHDFYDTNGNAAGNMTIITKGDE